jgi:hypothetical protein
MVSSKDEKTHLGSGGFEEIMNDACLLAFGSSFSVDRRKSTLSLSPLSVAVEIANCASCCVED